MNAVLPPSDELRKLILPADLFLDIIVSCPRQCVPFTILVGVNFKNESNRGSGVSCFVLY